MIVSHIMAAICLVFAGFFIFFRLKTSILPSLVFKTFSGIAFVFTAVFAFFQNQTFPLYASLVICGAIMGLCGDIFLQIKRFDASFYKKFLMLGMAFFALGHFFYFAALLLNSEITIYPFLGAIVMTILSYIGLSTKKFEKVGKIKVYCSMYYFVLTATLFQAIYSYATTLTDFALVFMIGAILFFISDTILAFIYFARADRKRFTIINLTTYYLAQLCIALSILFL